MADVLVLGSSHIEKLRLFIQAGPSLYNFDCHDRKIECFGISGGKIENSTHVKLLENKINTLRPKRVVVQIGGNDLDTAGIDEEGVRLLILRLINIFSLFRNKYKLDVYLCQFMFREKTRNVHPVQYNELVISANRLLKEELQSVEHTGIVYWKLKGLKQSASPIFYDGVHLNRECGLPKYYKCIRGAILNRSQN